MSKLRSMFVREVEGKQIRLAQYYRSKTPPSEDWVIAGVELVFEDDTCMRFFICGEELVNTSIHELD